ncbi:MAG: helix-turn-helix domain-containing protein [Proteobacteria bacterium]|nr:helix-turn-helix domain-containing protein [Pseudomonadota bacterium]
MKKIKKLDTPDLSQRLTAVLLGQAIKARRTQSKLRLKDAAALCGVAKHTFMKIEQGQQASQFGNVLKICFGLGIKLRIVPWLSEDEVSNEWY